MHLIIKEQPRNDKNSIIEYTQIIEIELYIHNYDNHPFIHSTKLLKKRRILQC